MKCVVLTTAHEEEDFTDGDNVLFFVGDYTDEKVLELLDKDYKFNISVKD